MILLQIWQNPQLIAPEQRKRSFTFTDIACAFVVVFTKSHNLYSGTND